MKKEEKYISDLLSSQKEKSEIKKLVKKEFPKFDLRSFGKIVKKLSGGNVIPIGRIKEPPYELKPGALKIWHSFWSNKRKDLEILPIDNILLAAFCVEAALYEEMRTIIIDKGPTFKTPNGYIAVRPEVAIGNTALSNAQSIAKEFGLTLKSRISMDLVEGVGVQGDLFEALTKQIGGAK